MNSNWQNIHKETLTSFLQALDESNIRWVIVRNHEGLPDSNHSKDIDIAIEKKNWRKTHRITLEIFNKHGFSNFELRKYQFIRCYTFFNLSGHSFKLDFFDCNEYMGLVTHSFSDLYINRELHNEIVGSGKLDNAIIILLRPLLGGNYIKPKYISEILEVYRQNPDLFQSELEKIFGKRDAENIITFLNEKDIQQLPSIRKRLVKSLFRRNINRYKFRAVFRIINHYISTLRTRLRAYNKNYFIAVLGADGTGKSTFIDELTKSINHYYSADNSKCFVAHHRPSIIPNLGALGEKAGVMKEDTDFTNPQRGKPVGFLSSLARMTYYWSDYVIGIPLIRIKNAKADRYTIFDRYIYDFLIDPRRSRINLPYNIRKLYTKLAPQPRLVFVLQTNAETIYKRKQELSLEEIERQQKEFSKLTKTHKRFISIDAGLSPEEMTRQAIQIIIHNFAKANSI